MAIVVEDGSKVSGANSYVSVANVTTYATLIGNTSWGAASTTNQEAAIIRAMRYIESSYRMRWKAYRTWEDQTLSWPRWPVVDEDGYQVQSNEIPTALKDAVAEAALRELAETDVLQPDLDRGGAVASETNTIGPITESKTYAAGAPVTKTFPMIESLLAPYLKPRGMKLRRR